MLRRPVDTGRKRSAISAASRQTMMLASESRNESNSSQRRLISLRSCPRKRASRAKNWVPRFRGDERRSMSSNKCWRLGPGKHRLALLHEGGAAFDVILAAEAGVDDILHARDVAGRLVLHEFADHRLERLDGERRIAGDRL